MLTLVVLVCVSGLLLSCGDPAPEQSGPKQPQPPGTAASNVLLITLDAVRADRLGCYGYQAAQTPALDELAADGVLFTQAFSQSPLTLPSHATIMTGLFPAEHSLLENGRYRLPDDIPTLAEVFRQHGFATGAFVGGAFLDKFYGLGRGFDTYQDTISAAKILPEQWMAEPAEQVTESALAWLRKNATRPSNNATANAASSPFFCWVNFADARIAEYLASEQSQDISQTYDQQISTFDIQIGRLIEFLKEANLRETTLIVVVGASGEALGQHSEHGRGLFLYSSTLHVPLIISAPESLKPGLKVQPLVTLANLAPTILDLQGWPNALSPESKNTTSAIARTGFLSAVQDTTSAETASYARTDYPHHKFRWSSLQSLTTDKWHYIHAPAPELYDRQADPAQANNLAQTSPQQIATLQKMLSELENGLPPRPPVLPTLSPETRQIVQGLSQLPEEFAADAPGLSAAQKDPKDMIDAYQAYRAGLPLLAREKYPEALRHLTAATTLSPNSPEILLALSRVQQFSGNLDDAYKNARLAAAMDSTNPDALSQMASVFRATDRWSQAIGYFQASLALKKLQPRTIADMALAEWGQRELSEAITSLKKALAIRPNYTNAHYNLAVLLAETGRRRQAIPHFRTVAENEPDSADAIYQWAALLTEEGRFSEAARRFERVLQLQPDHVEARYYLATILAKQNKPDQAIPHYRQVLEHAQDSPLSAEIQHGLGLALLRQSKYSEAITHLQEAVRLQPSMASAHCWLAQALLATGNKDQALAEYKLALKLAPNFPPALAPLSTLTLEKSLSLAQEGRFAPAIALLRESRELLPRDHAIADALARYLATCPQDQLRDGKLAISLADRAVRATGRKIPEYLDTLAAAYAEQGEYSDAARTANEAMVLASKQGRDQYVSELSVRARLYEAGQPYRERP